jgi:hypothetical protein
MKYLLILSILLSLDVFAEEKTCDQLLKDGATQEHLAYRECCSWHGWVCYEPKSLLRLPWRRFEILF